eukprot:CAMPEP_0172449072 /NCGR_PEP_ID=MMETSP1065-20121228/7882_1 /TAXON_ID=265537 /ORGANISM="Amphiprora paludosa, Strain CCMP125" /LENGTH=299 /DNA_ID=CAMNT_0013200671 /DNA_START=142 /DNA_END=1041 /DNA_ORIENTATION=+
MSKLSSLLLLSLATTQAFQAAMPSSPFVAGRTALFQSADASAPAKLEEPKSTSRPERVVPEILPTLYVYDHCPFCVRVRLALGLKNIKHNLHFLANDDVETPTKLIGKKMAPIMEWGDLIMPESMDIINYVDQDERCGPTNYIAPATGRQDIKEWQGGVRDLLRSMQRPRYVATGLLPEFQQLDARHAFVKNHQLPGYTKPDWKLKPLSEQLTEYAELMARDPADDIEELNRQLVALDDIIYSSEHCSEGGISFDDVDLFSRLRSITIIDGVQWPEKLRAYMDNFAEIGDIPLYDEMAL